MSGPFSGQVMTQYPDRRTEEKKQWVPAAVPGYHPAPPNSVFYSIREMDWAEMKKPSRVINPVMTISASPSTVTISVPSSMGRPSGKRSARKKACIPEGWSSCATTATGSSVYGSSVPH